MSLTLMLYSAVCSSKEIRIQHGCRPEKRLELQQCGSPREASAEGAQQDARPRADAALRAGVADTQRNGCRRRVAVFIKVDEYFFASKLEAVSHGFDDAEVCLMRNEQVDVFERQTVVLQQFGADGGKAAHSLLEDFTPLHLEVKIVLNRIAGLVVAVRPAADGKQGILPPVRTAPDIPEAGGRGQAPLGRPGVAVRQHGGRGAVATSA